MKQVFIILIPVILFSIFLAGGLTENPINNGVKFPQAYTLNDSTAEGAKDVLQIRSLTATSQNIPSQTPTPTLSPTPSPSTSCTPNQKVAIDLILDVSASMCQPYDNRIMCESRADSRINKLKSAVISFASNLRNEDLIGVQSFSGDILGRPDVENVVGIDTWANNRLEFNNKINGLRAEGNTHMKDGFYLADQLITQAQTDSRFQNYEWKIIFLSDGVPNDNTDFFRAGPDISQDPTLVANTLKARNLRIITVGLDLTSLANPAYQYTIPNAQIVKYAGDLLKSISSPEANNIKNYYESPTANDLDSIYQSIIGQIRCP